MMAQVFMDKELVLNALSTVIALGLFYFGPIIGIVLSIYLLTTSLFPFLLLYFIWIYVDKDTPHRDGRRLKWVRSLPLYQRFRDYFPQRLIKTADLSPSRNYILCVFPHGAFCSAVHAQLVPENRKFQMLFPGIQVTTHTLNLNFYFPFSREYILSTGFCSVSRKALEYQLSKPGGRAVCLVIGGSAESMISSPGTHRIIAKSRKGFVKLALQTGTALVPVYSFGETDLYNQLILSETSFIRRIQQAIRKFTGVAPILISGKFCSPLLPFARPVYTVVGNPIIVEKIENPSQADIDDLHQKFLQEITSLFDNHKRKYIVNAETTHLCIED